MNNRLSDEDRADTARMLGGCGWYGLAALVAIAALVAWAVLS